MTMMAKAAEPRNMEQTFTVTTHLCAYRQAQSPATSRVHLPRDRASAA
jgi:hypothetical protein